MNIKLTLLGLFMLASLTINSNPLIHESLDATTFSPVLHNEIEITIKDTSYISEDTYYTINVYYLGILYSSKTTHLLKTKAIAPNLSKGDLVVEVEKHSRNARVSGEDRQLIATEVRLPAKWVIITLDDF